ncbi:MAG: DUF4837 family protein [Bacteroidaceae bacterium]|nr:DUF4837 family protein [Bacteroidaceae bacterium]
MKKLFLSLVSSILLIACTGDGPTLFKPSSSGLPYEVLVVCDKEMWEAPSGRALFNVLDTDIPAIPQPERSFRISQTSPEGFDNLLLTFRNVIEVDINPQRYTQTKYKFRRDPYSTPQVIMTIQSPSEKEFKEYVEANGQTIIDFFTSTEMNRELRRLEKPNAHNGRFLDSLNAKFGCEMFVPIELQNIKSGKDFIWVSDMQSVNSVVLNFAVYSYPYTDRSNFTLENFLQKRDSIMKANLPGGRPNSYMKTEHDYVVMKETEFRERYMQEVRGLWSMENDAMGGPFVSHSVVDEVNNRVIVAEAFVYAASRKKGDLIRKLEAALFSLRLPADKAIAGSTHIPEIIIEETSDSSNTQN